MEIYVNKDKKKREEKVSSLLSKYYTSEQPDATVVPQGHICPVGFPVGPCGTAPVTNAPLGWVDKPVGLSTSFLYLLISFHSASSFLAALHGQLTIFLCSPRNNYIIAQPIL